MPHPPEEAPHEQSPDSLRHLPRVHYASRLSKRAARSAHVLLRLPSKTRETVRYRCSVSCSPMWDKVAADCSECGSGGMSTYHAGTQARNYNARLRAFTGRTHAEALARVDVAALRSTV